MNDIDSGKTSSLVDAKLLSILRCPISGGRLELDEKNSRLISTKAKVAYPIRDGIVVLLEDEAQALNDSPDQ